MKSYAIIGIVAGLLGVIAYCPQVYKIYHNKSVTDVSLTKYLIIAASIVLWLTYGILIRNYVIVGFYGCLFILVLIILYAFYEYRDTIQTYL